jgi:hypothetical protein
MSFHITNSGSFGPTQRVGGEDQGAGIDFAGYLDHEKLNPAAFSRFLSTQAR